MASMSTGRMMISRRSSALATARARLIRLEEKGEQIRDGGVVEVPVPGEGDVAVRPLQAALVRLLAEFELHAAGVGVPLSDAFVLPSAACIAWRNVVLFVAFFPASTVTPGGTSTELSSIPPIFSTWNRANWSACCVVVIDSRVRTSISNKYSSFRPLEPAHRTRFDAATSGFSPCESD